MTAKLLPQGAVTVTLGGTLVATLSLNAHGPDWKHADQAEATATVEDAGGGPAKVVRGTLPVPDTEGGAIRFVETVERTQKGLHADYILGATRAMTLDGLHVSLLLPTSTFAGKTITLHTRPEKAAGEGAATAEETQQIDLPAELNQEEWQLFTGPASRAEIAAGTADAITLVPSAFEPTEEGAPEPPLFVIQDLRKWDQDVIEVRLSLVNADQGRLLSAWDKLHVALGLTFAREVRWQ